MRTGTEEAAAALAAHYPRIWFACHRRHVRDSESGGLISQHQASILDHLDAVDGTSLTDLAKHMGVTAGTMSVGIERLVRQGYVSRTYDDKDLRRVQLRLTEAGERMKDANSPLDPDRVASLFDQLTPEETRAAVNGLAILARAASAIGEARTTHRRKRA